MITITIIRGLTLCDLVCIVVITIFEIVMITIIIGMLPITINLTIVTINQV